MKLLISLNPKLSAVIDLILNIVTLILLSFLSSWLYFLLLFFTRQLLWLVLIISTYYPKQTLRIKHYVSLFIFSLGSFLTIIFIDWSVAFYSLMISYLTLTFVSFWLLPQSKIQFNIYLKPYTRWRFLLSSLGLAGILTGIQSILFYQILFQINSWIWYILSAVVAVAISIWWWYEYNIKITKKILIDGAIFLILMIELTWVIANLPIGNIISGLILTWLWYLTWLLMRFNLSTEGIQWSKQTGFLLINIFIFIAFSILFVRWK